MNDAGKYRLFRDRMALAIDPLFYPIGYLDYLLASGAAQLAATDRAAILFEARTYPSGLRDVHGLVAAGDLRDIVNELIPKAEEWGREQGCGGALIESRPGWTRILRQSGYAPHQVAVRKEL